MNVRERHCSTCTKIKLTIPIDAEGAYGWGELFTHILDVAESC